MPSLCGSPDQRTAPLTTVAVLRWVAAEPPPLPPEDQHWLRTFTGLVGRELGFVAVVFG